MAYASISDRTDGGKIRISAHKYKTETKVFINVPATVDIHFDSRIYLSITAEEAEELVSRLPAAIAEARELDAAAAAPEEAA
ncbi:MAG: hypothetical protein JKY47_00810 [Thalassospira sp.]|jgi:hypothetical protein|uniref:hypothetical protein n=1 Tax=Thalassospira sp. 11-3 TaxID=2135614 RepID=UPI000D75C4E6|nr:hypothetical protein [Thalassospira sp. 11-3]MBL4839352.1 hypothetical protein [Thalassospira sp.]PXX36236.1 hypothetical protein C7967_101629 [Thalassospira sp. 11-3]